MDTILADAQTGEEALTPEQRARLVDYVKAYNDRQRELASGGKARELLERIGQREASRAVDRWGQPLANRVEYGSKDLRFGEKHDASGTPSTVGYAHGPGGFLSYPGVDPDVYSTIVGDRPGVLSMLQTMPDPYRFPTFQTITGIHAGSGEEPSGICDDAPTGGTMKAGLFTFPFGRLQRSTREINLNRLGQLNDRADPMDLRLVNRPIGNSIFAPLDSSRPTGDILRNEIDIVMFERAIEFHRVLSRLIWTGDPTTTPNPDAGYVEFAGFSKLVDLNWRDAQTGNASPSMYPDIKDAGFVRIDSEAGSAGVVRMLTYMMRYLNDKAERQGITSVRHIIAMRDALFYELSAVWPCAYFTTLCSFNLNGNRVQNIDLGDQINLRDRMRREKFLTIDGIDYQVVTDDWIPELNANTNGNLAPGVFASDIYVIPLSANGRVVTMLDYADFNNPSLRSAIASDRMILARVEAGAYLEWPRQKNICIQWQALIEPRLKLRTPWLFGRITNVAYAPLQYPAQPDPASGYWQDGGETTRTAPSLYKPF